MSCVSMYFCINVRIYVADMPYLCQVSQPLKELPSQPLLQKQRTIFFDLREGLNGKERDT